jgi:hypothetical protein
LALTFLLVTPLACGSSTSDDDPGAGGSSGNNDSHANLEPAANLDVTTCGDIHTIAENAQSQCSICCGKADAVASSFIYQGTCTCLLPSADDPGKSVCASAIADGETCGACCSEHNYLVSGWVGADATNPGQCGCAGVQDTMICDAYAGTEEACTNCCAHEGFIQYGYGPGNCWCLR